MASASVSWRVSSEARCVCGVLEARIPALRQAPDALEPHVGFLSDHEEDAARPQVVEEGEVRVGAVGEAHVARLQPGAERLRPGGVVVARVLHDG